MLDSKEIEVELEYSDTELRNVSSTTANHLRITMSELCMPPTRVPTVQRAYSQGHSYDSMGMAPKSPLSLPWAPLFELSGYVPPGQSQLDLLSFTSPAPRYIGHRPGRRCCLSRDSCVLHSRHVPEVQRYMRSGCTGPSLIPCVIGCIHVYRPVCISTNRQPRDQASLPTSGGLLHSCVPSHRNFVHARSAVPSMHSRTDTLATPAAP